MKSCTISPHLLYRRFGKVCVPDLIFHSILQLNWLDKLYHPSLIYKTRHVHVFHDSVKHLKLHVTVKICLLNQLQVLIIEGETGSGKTTQIPQYLHEAVGTDLCTCYATMAVVTNSRFP